MTIAAINHAQGGFAAELAKTETNKILKSEHGNTIGAPGSAPASGEDLAASFGKALSDARELDKKATDAAEKFASGDPSMGIHEVMIATEKANIAVRYAATMKNKALEAYRELMNTQV